MRNGRHSADNANPQHALQLLQRLAEAARADGRMGSLIVNWITAIGMILLTCSTSDRSHA